MELKLYIKQTQQFNALGQPIVFNGSNPQNLVATVNATLAPGRQWPQFGSFIDATAWVSDLFKLSLTWSTDRDTFGVVQPGATQSKKSASGNLTFEADAYKLIKQWLFDDISAPLNSVDVRIEHTGCGTYEDYTFKAADVTLCETFSNACTFEVSLKQKDEPLNCIKRTLIEDNWQGWFQSEPQGGKKHPRFSYCNEQRPNGMLVVMWYLLTLIMSIVLPVLIPIIVIINVILTIIRAIVNAINAVIDFLNKVFGFGIGKPGDPPPNIDILDVFDGIANMYIESGGCGREHPAPLVRDYISNVCRKCNVEVDDVSAPIFFATAMQVETSGRGLQTMPNPHYNACYFYAPVKRGVRRFKKVDDDSNINNTDFYIADNSPLKTLDQFLDELKTLYNADWRLVNNKLYFQRKDYFAGNGYLYDFTASSPDRLKLLEGICFEWNEVKYPAATKGLYMKDPTDKPGNEAHSLMNCILSHGLTDNNPSYEGMQDKETQFGATRFRLDGAAEDYIYDALQVLLNMALLSVVILIPPMGIVFYKVMNTLKDAFGKFADYALLIEGETAVQPKLLLWDGLSYTNAKALRTHAGWPVTGLPMPAPNWVYNSLPWNLYHYPDTFVRGQGLTLPPFHPGYYTVTDLFGTFEIKRAAMLVNYPMYFEHRFENTMWDWFHWIDDPAKNPRANMNFTAKIELCCGDLQKLKVFGDASAIALHSKVKLPLPFYQDGRIKEVEVSYDISDDTGAYIQLKGNV